MQLIMQSKGVLLKRPVHTCGLVPWTLTASGSVRLAMLRASRRHQHSHLVSQLASSRLMMPPRQQSRSLSCNLTLVHMQVRRWAGNWSWTGQLPALRAPH